MNTLDIKQILEILPHRYPFLMVDGVRQISAERVIAFKNVSINEPQFQGHFPGEPVMPGVLVVEALAQAGALLAHHLGGFDPAHQAIYFMSIEQAKFRAPVRPGHCLELEVVPLRQGKAVWRMAGTARVGEQVMASAQYSAIITDRPERL